jgi:hypothetical protein
MHCSNLLFDFPKAQNELGDKFQTFLVRPAAQESLEAAAGFTPIEKEMVSKSELIA